MVSVLTTDTKQENHVFVKHAGETAASGIMNALKKERLESARKWILWIPPWSGSDMRRNFSAVLMCTINFVNPRPTGQAVATVEAQIRPYIREHRRADLFQSPR